MASNFHLSTNVQAELQCSICIHSYNDPVTLTCGHSFCRTCLLGVFEQSSKDAPNRYGQPVRYIDCPMCRVHYYSTLSQIQSMSVNLSLRNIVSAIGDKADTKPTTCKTHQKPLCIFCSDCKSTKCLTCFVDVCGKSLHNTREIDEMAEEMRVELKEKLKGTERKKETLQKACKGEDAVVTQLKKLAKQELLDMVEMLDMAESKALSQDMEAMQVKVDSMKRLMNCSDSTLVASQDEIAASTSPNSSNSKLTDFHKSCAEVIHSMKRNVQQLKDILKSSGVDPDQRPAPFPRPSVSNSEREEDSLVRALNRPLSCSSQTSSSQASESEEVIYRAFYENAYVYSVSSLHPFIANTDQGCSYAKGGHNAQWFLRDRVVHDTCLIGDTRRTLAVVDHQLEVYENDGLVVSDPPLFVLPLPGAPAPCHFECVGATDVGTTLFFASDTNNACIHVWSELDRRWCSPIDITLYLCQPHPSFKMCVYLDNIYVTFHHEEKVYAFDLRGMELWCSSISRPNGITADERGIYVCEGERGNHCITILNLDGTYQQSILGAYLERPWSVAVRGDEILVLERLYRHTLQVLPMSITVFRLTHDVDDASTA